MIDRIFLAHPRSVDESYVEHAGMAFGFGTRMIGGGIACLIHGIVPVWFTRTGSNTVKALYARMTARQPAYQHRAAPFSEPEWQLEYEI